MRKVQVSFVILGIFALAAGCSQSGASGPSSIGVAGNLAQVSGQGPGNTPMSAVMQFGQENVGSPFPPGSGHDASAHGADNLVPRTVVIAVGGTVTFNVPAAVHQVGIYAPGTQPSDINVASLTSLGAFAGCGSPLPPQLTAAPLVIADTTNQVAAYPVPCLTPTQVTHTFTAPGRYLVICKFLPHFEAGMWGWVEVV